MSGDRLQLDRRRGLALHEARPAGFGARNPSDRIDTAHPRALFLEISEENRDPVLRLAAKCGRRHPGTLILVGGIPATLAPGSVVRRVGSAPCRTAMARLDGGGDSATRLNVKLFD